jgi:hypothetical protein
MLRMLRMVALLALALPTAGSAQQPPSPGPERILIYVYMTHPWKSPGAAARTEVQTKAGAWVAFPPDGMSIEWASCGGVAVRLPRGRLDEIRRITEEELEISPRKWHVLSEKDLRLPMACNKF